MRRPQIIHNIIFMANVVGQVNPIDVGICKKIGELRNFFRKSKKNVLKDKCIQPIQNRAKVIILKKGEVIAPEKRIKRQKEYVRDVQVQFVRAIQKFTIISPVIIG